MNEIDNRPLATQEVREMYNKMCITRDHTDGLGAYHDACQEVKDFRARYRWPEDEKAAQTQPQRPPRIVRPTGRKVARTKEEALAFIEAAFS
ncbi:MULTISPECIES: hypothetical protein [unclassified Thioalkalivibrio]|uniref:hypothetical protein n=1 Tax=unclassified Thioalkalivibrio TaxID=2621013 RepID=UPI00037A3766|nr:MULTISPECIES: hypothetical protein [unclassified Thioalkalivibrio]